MYANVCAIPECPDAFDRARSCYSMKMMTSQNLSSLLLLKHTTDRQPAAAAARFAHPLDSIRLTKAEAARHPSAAAAPKTALPLEHTEDVVRVHPPWHPTAATAIQFVNVRTLVVALLFLWIG
jgi:hypothetical protein